MENRTHSLSSQVRCSAEGGRPAPSFAWMLDNEKYNGAVVDEENAQKLTYTSKPEHNGKTLSCVVTHKGFTKEALAAGSNKASIVLDIRFKPVASTTTTTTTEAPQEFCKVLNQKVKYCCPLKRAFE